MLSSGLELNIYRSLKLPAGYAGSPRLGRIWVSCEVTGGKRVFLSLPAPRAKAWRQLSRLLGM